MDEALIDAMHEYFRAGGEMDVEKFDSLYAPEFQNLRMDRDGRTITFTKAQFMARLRQMKGQSAAFEPSEDVKFLATSTYDDHASILFRRVKEGKPALYNFVWRLRDGRPLDIIREFTVEEDLSSLIALVEELKRSGA